eukprot:4534779-Karenia_brevis.AAC.1
MAKACELRWVGRFKAYFACTVLSQLFQEIYNPVNLGPRVHLHMPHSAMLSLFPNSASSVNEREVYE